MKDPACEEAERLQKEKEGEVIALSISLLSCQFEMRSIATNYLQTACVLSATKTLMLARWTYHQPIPQRATGSLTPSNFSSGVSASSSQVTTEYFGSKGIRAQESQH